MSVAPEQASRMPPSNQLLLRVFAAAIFLSAALLFAVQPMFTKMVLPRLGGTPSVWSVAMVFFQAVLLAGYAYAHALTKYLPGRRSIVVHLVVMVAASCSCRLRSPRGGDARRRCHRGALAARPVRGLDRAAVLRALGERPAAAGVVRPHRSSQRAQPVFSLRGEQYRQLPRAHLLSVRDGAAHPLGQQTRAGPCCSSSLIALIAWCGLLMLRSRAPPMRRPTQATSKPPPTWRDAARWVALAAVPSALLISVTSHISTDIAAAPFMWVIPLALYLATFVIVFQTRPILRHDWMVAIEPMFIVALVGIMVLDIRQYCARAARAQCRRFLRHHAGVPRRARRSRPAAQHLTAFYMWMSAGGVIGGIFAGLIAPNVFSWVLEYPLLIVLAILCRPGLEMPTRHAHAAALARRRAVVAVVAFPGLTERYVTDEKTFNWTIGAMLVVRGPRSRASRCRSPP